MKLRIDDLVKLDGRCIEAFLFDLDGTLVDSSEAIANAIKTVLDTKGYPYDGDKIKGMIGVPLEDMFRELVQGLSGNEIRLYVAEYRKHYSVNHLKHTAILPGVVELLRKLKERDFKLGIVTTKYRKFVLETLGFFSLIELFDTIVTGYEVKRHKPYPDVILEATRRLGLNPVNCVLVGDSPMDIEAGRRAGAITIAVLTGPYSKQQVLEVNPNFIVKSLESI